MEALWSDLSDFEAPPNGEAPVVSAELRASPSDVEALASVLAEDERDRARRFRFSRDRERYVIARAILRYLLSEFIGGSPRDVRLNYGAKGKPGVNRSESSGEHVHFNVAHSRDLALFAFARSCALGVDVEHVVSVPELVSIAKSHFSATERTRLLGLPTGERTLAFHTCW